MKLWTISILLLAGCANRYGGVDPQRPPFHCVTNTTDRTVTIMAEGKFASEKLGRAPGMTVYRMLDVRRAKPGAKACFRWPWVSREGRIVLASGPDTTWGEWFDPWSENVRTHREDQ